MTAANKRVQGQRQETLTGLRLPEGIQPEAGQQLEVNDKGFSKTFLITRLPE